jgi:FkbM family methyltransferase
MSRFVRQSKTEPDSADHGRKDENTMGRIAQNGGHKMLSDFAFFLFRARRKIRRILLGRFRPSLPSFRQTTYRGVKILVLANEEVGWRLLVDGSYEHQEIEWLERMVKTGDTCVDVGANVGIMSLFMAKGAGKDGKVFAFEPASLNRAILEMNLELNGLKNTLISNSILSDIVGSRSFSVSEDSAFSSIRPTGRKEQAAEITVPSTTLDHEFAEKNCRVDVLKIDVEGAELLVLQGGKKLFNNSSLRPRAIFIELSTTNQSAYGYGPEAIITFLGKFGYKPNALTEEGLKPGWPHQNVEDALFLLD